MEPIAYILIIAVAIGIFFLCRELNCWYLKINARKELLESMVENQKQIIKLLKKQLGEEVEEEAGDKTVGQLLQENKKTDFYVGQKVKTKVEKYGLPVGALVRIDRIEGQNLVCSQEMREIGTFTVDEVEA